MTKHISCDLCKNKSYEFIVTSKHLRDSLDVKLKYKGQTRHVVKHLCLDCFIKLFPEEVENL